MVIYKEKVDLRYKRKVTVFEKELEYGFIRLKIERDMQSEIEYITLSGVVYDYGKEKERDLLEIRKHGDNIVVELKREFSDFVEKFLEEMTGKRR